MSNIEDEQALTIDDEESSISPRTGKDKFNLLIIDKEYDGELSFGDE